MKDFLLNDCGKYYDVFARCFGHYKTYLADFCGCAKQTIIMVKNNNKCQDRGVTVNTRLFSGLPDG